MAPIATVTLDASVLDETFIDHLRRVSAGIVLDVKTVTVNLRERGAELKPVPEAVPETAVWDESRWDEGVWGGVDQDPVLETAVLGESSLGSSVLARQQPLLEPILRIISSGSFPPPGSRDDLAEGQKHQLRDAMTLEAHSRDGRDVLITADLKGFVTHGRREQLEALCGTRIIGRDEVGRLWP